MIKRVSGLLSIIIGAVLLLLNGYGLTTSLRPAGIESMAQAQSKRMVSSHEFRERIQRGDLSAPEYARRVNELIYEGMVHYWVEPDDPPELRRALNTHIPIQENYLLYAYGLFSEDYQLLELVNSQQAFERGFGYCSQKSIVLAGILEDHDVHSRVVALNGHVVVIAEVRPGQWWIFDPDYGVVMPYSMAAIERDPEIVEQFYSASDSAILTPMYASPDDNRTTAVADYNTRHYQREQFSRVAVWLFPVLLLLFGILLLASRGGRHVQ